MVRSRCTLVARCALLAMIVAFGLGLAPSGRVRAADTAVTQADLNLRAGPGLDYAVILVMPAGSTVTLSGATLDGWASIIYGNTAGWAYSDLLLRGGATSPAPSASPSASPSPNGTRAVVSAESGLNVRAAPGLTTITGVLPAGAIVVVLGEPQDADGYAWIEIADGAGMQGWVASQFLVPVKP